MKKFNKGFTLIELLVVIAIIGILSSIVLASLSSARTKGEDAAITSMLSNMRAQAELYYSTNTKYGLNTSTVASGACPNAAVADDNAAGAKGMFGVATPGLLTLSQGLVARATAANTDCVVIANGAAWAAAAVLKSSPTTAYCVDSTGQTKNVTLTTANTIGTLGAAGSNAISAAGACN